MGLSVSASAAVVFLGVFVAAGIGYPAVANGAERVAAANDAAADRALDRQHTAVAVANATHDAGNATLVVTATNHGATALDADRVTLLVDNEYTAAAVAVDGAAGSSVWLPGETARLTVGGVTTAPERVTVVVDHGVRDWAEVA